MKGMKIIVAAGALMALAIPAHADRCSDALTMSADSIQQSNTRFDALGQRVDRLVEEIQTSDQALSIALDRFAVDYDYAALSEGVLHVVDDRRRIIFDFASIIQDQNAVWQDRERALKNALEACH